eukprot:COSAG05_NODE_1306_length_5202_cov_2.857505_3_plen_146_part_00
MVLHASNVRCPGKFWSQYKAKDKTCRILQCAAHDTHLRGRWDHLGARVIPLAQIGRGDPTREPLARAVSPTRPRFVFALLTLALPCLVCAQVQVDDGDGGTRTPRPARPRCLGGSAARLLRWYMRPGPSIALALASLGVSVWCCL